MTAVELGVTCGTPGVAVMVAVGGIEVAVGKKVERAVAEAAALADELPCDSFPDEFAGTCVADARSGKLQASTSKAASNTKNSLRDFILAPRRLSYPSCFSETIGIKAHVSLMNFSFLLLTPLPFKSRIATAKHNVINPNMRGS